MHKRKIAIGVLVIISIIISFLIIYMHNISKKYNLDDIYLFCSYNDLITGDDIYVYIRNGEMEANSYPTPHKVVKITKLENYFYIGLLEDLAKRTSYDPEKNYDNYISLAQYGFEHENEKIYHVGYARGEHLLAFIIFFGYYLRIFYPYLFLIWLCFGLILFKTAKSAFREYGKKQVILPKVYFLAFSVVIMTLFNISAPVWKKLLLNMNGIINIWAGNLLPYYVNIYIMIIFAVIQTVYILISNKEHRIKKTFTYILPAIIIYTFMYCVLENIPKRFGYSVSALFYKKFLVSSTVRDHYLIFWGTIFFAVGFVIYYLFSRISHKPKDRVLQSFVYSFCTVLLTAFPVFFDS